MDRNKKVLTRCRTNKGDRKKDLIVLVSLVKYAATSLAVGMVEMGLNRLNNRCNV